MPDSIPFEILIKTIAEVTGMEVTQAHQEKILDLTRQQVAANEAVAESAAEAAEASAGGTGPRGPAYSPNMSGSDAPVAAPEKQKELAVENELYASEVRRANLMAQRQIIIDMQVEALEAEADGNNELAAELAREVEIRKAALVLQQGANIEEDEAVALAQRQVAAEEEIVAMKQAQAALNEQLIAQAAAQNELEMVAQEEFNKILIEEEEMRLAQEEKAVASVDRVYGPRGRATSILKNFMSQNAAATVGIGLFGGYMAYEAIHRWTEELKKANEERDRASEKQLESEARTMREISDLDSLSEAQRLRTSLEEKLNEALEERANLPEDTTQDKRDAINQTIGAIEVEIGAIDRVNARTVEREDAARRVKEQEEATRDALNEQLKTLDMGEEAGRRRLETLRQQNALEAEIAIKQIELLVAQGKMTPEAGAAARSGIAGSRDAKDFAAQQAELQAEIDAEQKKAEIAAKAAAEHKAQVDAATKAQQEASDKRAAIERARADAAGLADAAKQAQTKADEAAADVKDAEQIDAFGEPDSAPDQALPGLKKAAGDTQKQADDLQQQAIAAQTKAGSPPDLEKARVAAALAAKTLEETKATQDDLDKKNKEQSAASAARIKEINEEIAAQSQLNDLKQQSAALDDAIRGADAQAHDKKEKEEREKQQAGEQLDKFRTEFDAINGQKAGRQAADNNLVALIEGYIQSHKDLSAEEVDAFKRLEDAVKKNAQETDKLKQEVKQIASRGLNNRQ